jgi:hypothetical protein
VHLVNRTIERARALAINSARALFPWHGMRSAICCRAPGCW